MTHEGTRDDGRPSLVAGVAMILALGSGSYDAGCTEQARRFAHDTLDVVRRAGFTMMAAFGVALMGWYEALNGDLEEGERRSLPGVRDLQEHGASAFLASARPLLADIRVLQGRYAEARRLGDTAKEQGGAHDRIDHPSQQRSRARPSPSRGNRGGASCRRDRPVRRRDD